jgi:hypothetical protein
LNPFLQAWKEIEMHLQTGELRAYLDHELDQTAMERTSLHLGSCPECQARYQAIEARSQRVQSQMDVLQTTSNRSPMPARAARERLKNRHNQPQMEVTPMLKKIFSRRTRPVWAALAVIAILAVSLAVPSVRAIANNFLGLFRVQQFTVIQIDENQLESQLNEVSANQLEALFADSVIFEGGGKPLPVASLAEASQQAGFSIRLPSNAPEPVVYEVLPSLHASMQIDVRRAQGILDELGHDDVRLSKSLDGELITVDVPAAVAANYGDCQVRQLENDPAGPSPIMMGQNCISIIQVPSPTVNAPPDLDINQLGQAALEVLGMSEQEAASFAQNIDWTTTLIIPIPRYRAQYEDVQVDGVPGTLVSSGGGGRNTALLWVKNGVVYAITGQLSKQAAIKMANSLQ